MKKNLLLSTMALGASMFAANAQALTISDSFGPLAEQTTEINQSGLLDLFDANLGVLNSVTFTFTGSATTNISLTNNATQAQTTRATATVDLLANSGTAGINALFVPNNSLPLSATTGFVTLAAGATQSFGPLAATNFWTATWTLPAQLSLFQALGGGTFDVLGSSLSGISITGGGGNIASSQSTTAGIGATVVYDYTVRTTTVPEPASLALLGIGLAGLGLGKRKQAV